MCRTAALNVRRGWLFLFSFGSRPCAGSGCLRLLLVFESGCTLCSSVAYRLSFLLCLENNCVFLVFRWEAVQLARVSALKTNKERI